MANLKKVGSSNYELHPKTKIRGFDQEAWQEQAAVVTELKDRCASIMQQTQKVVVCFDFYPGVNKSEIYQIIQQLQPDKVFDMEDYALSEPELLARFDDYITTDRVFGILCHKKIDTLFDERKLEIAKKEVASISQGLTVVLGVGASLVVGKPSLYVYCNLTRWKIQLRYREGMPNWHCSNVDDPVLTKYKRGFFIEWRLADRHKKAMYDSFDYVLDSEKDSQPKMITGEAFRGALSQLSRQPFRMQPYFDPGVWGGHWMQEKFGLDKEQENFAWSFDGVPEENSINLEIGSVVLSIPAIDLVLYRPREVIGDRVHARFGAEFPIRFDLLDTMGGGNLSLQVHPLTEYIQSEFGMHYTQDESYYILDAKEEEETFVYLGVKKDVNPDDMLSDLKAAERGGKEFPAELYVNKVPVKKHDHILIPAGTTHCSGKNTMVLEISATPYIFTFKLWDWGRVGLDGLPRPIHVEHGIKNIQWDRDTDWIYENLVQQEKVIEKGTDYEIRRTGLHSREFIETIRYDVSSFVEIKMKDSVHVMNLVEGEKAFIESVDNSFAPFEIHYAETVIVPASVGTYKIVSSKDKIKMIVACVRQ